MVRFDENDRENKYGETGKMIAINDLIESGKTIEDAWFEVNEEDLQYYKSQKEIWDEIRDGDELPVIVHYIND